MPKNNRTRIIVLLVVIVIALMTATFTAEAGQGRPDDPITPVIEQVEQSGQYGFTAQVEQTLIPRPIAGNIGRNEERVDMVLTGDVELPDYALIDLRFEGDEGGSVLTIEQDGADVYLIQGGERTQIENPLSETTTDFVGYLRAADNVRVTENPDQPQLTIYQFDIDGEKYADYVLNMMRRQLPPEKQGE
ncbi:MAG: hypothetical protein WAM60_14760 [Candidatus Promineifilaceae bacterium]